MSAQSTVQLQVRHTYDDEDRWLSTHCFMCPDSRKVLGLFSGLAPGARRFGAADTKFDCGKESSSRVVSRTGFSGVLDADLAREWEEAAASPAKSSCLHLFTCGHRAEFLRRTVLVLVLDEQTYPPNQIQLPTLDTCLYHCTTHVH